MNETPPDAQETKRRLILFAGLAAETLTKARTLARRTKKVHKLLRTDGPSDLQTPHSSKSAPEVSKPPRP
jgi:hypothetical protein